MALVKVKNLNGTSKYQPTSGKSWFEEWKERKKYLPSYCSSNKCFETKDLVGAHVKKIDSGEWYIVPLCRRCNSKNSAEEFWIDELFLVPVVDIESKKI